MLAIKQLLLMFLPAVPIAITLLAMVTLKPASEPAPVKKFLSVAARNKYHPIPVAV
jgi:hypothetical protein